MIQNCFGPLGGLLAFLGALSFLTTLFTGIFALYDFFHLQEGEKMTPIMKLFFCGVVGIIIVIILGFINQTMVPPNCIQH